MSKKIYKHTIKFNSEGIRLYNKFQNFKFGGQTIFCQTILKFYCAVGHAVKYRPKEQEHEIQLPWELDITVYFRAILWIGQILLKLLNSKESYFWIVWVHWKERGAAKFFSTDKDNPKLQIWATKLIHRRKVFYD